VIVPVTSVVTFQLSHFMTTKLAENIDTD